MLSQHSLESFFHEIKCNGMTSFMEFMICDMEIENGPWVALALTFQMAAFYHSFCHTCFDLQLIDKFGLINFIITFGSYSLMMEKLK